MHQREAVEPSLQAKSSSSIISTPNQQSKLQLNSQSFITTKERMNATLLILVISAATLTARVVDAAPQSAELARLILQALEMNKANVEQSDIISAVSKLQEEDKPASNPYKDFKPPADHKLPSNGEQGATGNGQFFIPGLMNQITIMTFGGTLVTVEKIYEPEGKCVIMAKYIVRNF